MGFKFSLATVLRLREIAEEREERLLGQILYRIVQGRQNLLDIAERRQKITNNRETELQTHTLAAQLQSFYGQLEAMDLAKKQAEEQLVKLEALRNQQLVIYSAAHRDREVLAGMRTEQKEKYQAARVMREQKDMDDNFISRMRR